MSTSKVLQIPQITQIIAGTIRVNNPSWQGNTTTYLRSTLSAGASSCSVADNTNLANTDQIIIGMPGDQQTEAVLINGAVTLGSALSIATTLAWSHEIDAPVIKAYERSIKIYGASTSGGVLSAAIATVSIQWDKPYTEYTLITTDTAYAYYVVKFSDGTTDGSASAYVASSGVPYAAVDSFIEQALDLTNSVIDGSMLTKDILVRWANDCQVGITQFIYQDPSSGKYVQKDWSFEVIEDKTSIAVTQNENTYALSALASPSKYPNSDKSIIDIRLGTNPPLKKIDIDAYDRLMFGVARTTVATQPSIGQTTLALADGTEFNDGGGSILVGVDTVTYTSRTSNTLSGIPASGAGSITVAHPVGTAVWQGVTAGLPQAYVIFNGNVLLDRPIDIDNVGLHLKFRYYYAIPRLTLVSDTTVVTLTHAFQYYLASKIEIRKGNPTRSSLHDAMFNKVVLQAALADKIPVTDTYSYFNYLDPLLGRVNQNWNSDVIYPNY